MGLNEFRAELTKCRDEQIELLRFAEYYFAYNLDLPDFELTDNGAQIALSWFDGDPSAAERFTIFGRTMDDSAFAIWDDGPVVYLASEFEGTSVIANSAAEWLGLLAFGSESFTIDIECIDDEEWDGCPEPPDDLRRFRQWLRESLKIEAPNSPREAVLAARSQHPNLRAWIERWHANR